MSILARIDGEEIQEDDLVRFLKLSGKYDQIMEDMLTERLTVLAAREAGVEVSSEEVQERFDQIRRVQGLHRAKDAREFLERLGMSLDEFDAHLTDMLYKEKVLQSISAESAVKEYFNLHSPEFDSVEVGHIVLESEGKAREIAALLQDDPDSFHDLAVEHSIDIETRDRGGMIGPVLRGALRNAIGAKVFNAEKGAVLGPFASEEARTFEIFKVVEKHSASLDGTRLRQVQDQLYDKWLEDRAREYRIELL